MANTLGTQQQSPKPKTSGAAMMARGAMLTVVGIVISFISYSCASAVADNGGTGYYSVFYGIIVIGIIYFLIGLVRMLAGK
jgi:hypothetical protein